MTEEITGVDLVEWQLRVASGEALPKRQEELSINGWAMEARLYAEDPATGFLPSIGKLDFFAVPDRDVRLESGVMQGDTISPFYDPMIAKLIAKGPNREAAADKLTEAINRSGIWPVRTNAGFLYALLDEPVFRAGAMTTGFIQERGTALYPAIIPDDAILEEAAAELFSRDETGNWLRGVSENPWNSLVAFRMSAVPDPQMLVSINGETRTFPARITIDPWPPKIVWSRLDDGALLVTSKGQSYRVARYRGDANLMALASADGAILSPMPGRIIAVEVAAGDAVTKGQKLVTLEAMKMEHSLVAPFDGTVADLDAVVGGQTQEGVVLVRLEKVVAAD